MIEEFSDSEKLGRLWEALTWLGSYDPSTVDDMEGEFQFSVQDRTVGKRIEPRRIEPLLL